MSVCAWITGRGRFFFRARYWIYLFGAAQKWAVDDTSARTLPHADDYILYMRWMGGKTSLTSLCNTSASVQKERIKKEVDGWLAWLWLFGGARAPCVCCMRGHCVTMYIYEHSRTCVMVVFVARA